MRSLRIPHTSVHMPCPFGAQRDRAALVFEPPLAEMEVLLARIDSVLLGGHLHNREARHVIRGFARGAAGPEPGE